MRNARPYSSILAAIAACVLIAQPLVAAEVPLPDDIQISAPAADVPAEFRRFLGRWEGQWSGQLDQVLIVEKVESSGQATVVSAWGDYVRWRVTRDWVRWNAVISGETIKLDRFPNGSMASFVFRSDGNLGGTYEGPDYVHHGTFRHVAGN